MNEEPSYRALQDEELIALLAIYGETNIHISRKDTSMMVVKLFNIVPDLSIICTIPQLYPIKSTPTLELVHPYLPHTILTSWIEELIK